MNLVKTITSEMCAEALITGQLASKLNFAKGKNKNFCFNYSLKGINTWTHHHAGTAVMQNFSTCQKFYILHFIHHKIYVSPPPSCQVVEDHVASFTIRPSLY
jgi:hypothetical protein